VSRVEEPRVERSAQARFEQFFATRRFQPTLAFTPDGEAILFSSDISGQFNIWRSPVDGGMLEQLTAFEENAVRSITVTRDGREIVFTADRHGDEFHQIYRLPVEGGWPEQVTGEPNVQHFLHGSCWSPDGERLAYAANARVQTDMEVWVRDWASGDTRPVFGEGRFGFPASWSPDGSRLLVGDIRSNTDSSLFLVDPETREASELTPHEGEAKFVPGPWARDGSGFYLATDEGREFLGLAFFRLADGRYEWVETPDGDVEALTGSTEGGVLAWLVNERGWSRLYARDVDTGEALPTPDLPEGAYDTLEPTLTVSQDGSRAAVLWSEPRGPGELHVIELATGEARRITSSMLGGLREEDLIAPDEIVYESFDGRQIPAFLYRPDGEGPHPVVLSIHGGPQSQERPLWRPAYQYLLSRGIAVLATNIRGSTGYGKSYEKLICRDWGGGDLRDWEHAVEWLRAQDWVDAERIGCYGGSYGGFATLTCVTRLPDYWAAAVDVVGPSNLVTFAKAVPPTWRRFMTEWVGDPETEAEFLLERSPITYVDNVKAPLLVLQGAQDPRVVKGESDQMVERLRSLGRDVEYVVFEDEGHGFTKRANQIRANRLAVEWLERHLAG
jgi:dipeptidyl aminopeptidase/acylaminoacyl peptidase